MGILIALLCALILLFSFPTVSDAQTGAATGTATGAAAAPAAQQPTSTDAGKCTPWPGSWIYGCFWTPLMSLIGSLFLSIGVAVLKLAGTIFNMLVQWVIVNFAGTLGEGGLNIMTAIEKGWTVFRDLSNILIIGMFVFIAISTILGIKEYGAKKLLARILIIAVLINFSLLFTKVIIDFSNFTSFQIYKQMAGASGTTVENLDIAQSFLKPMKITSVFDTYGVVRKFSETNGAIMAFIYGLVGGILLLAIAAVLLYGCFLIAARGVLFIVLMLSSPLAFASFLIPNFSKGEYGWEGWWKSLLNSAVFAPLIMIFLGLSLAIINTAGKYTPGGVTLGSIILDPKTQSTGDVWKVVFIYLLGTGLLFISLKLASQFAGTISGFNLAQAITASPITQGSRLLSGPLRQGVGRWALKQAGAKADDAKKASMSAGLATSRAASYQDRADRTKNLQLKADLTRQASEQRQLALAQQKEAAHLAEQAAKKKKLADSKFNLMNTAGAEALTGAIGLKGFATGASGKDVKGFKSQTDEKAKHAADIADTARLTQEEREERRKAAQEEIRNRYMSDLENRKAVRDAAKSNMESANKHMEAAKLTRDAIHQEVQKDPNVQQATANLAAENASKNALAAAHNGQINTILQSIRTERDPAVQLQLHQQLEAAKNSHNMAMKQQEERISTAQDRLSHLTAQVGGKPLSDAEQALQRAKTEFDTLKSVFRSPMSGWAICPEVRTM